MKTRIIIGLFLPLVFLLSSCDPYQKLLKSSDYELKLAKAKEYYNNGACEKAIPLFEELMSVYKGTRDVENMYYYYAYAHYCNHDYVLASHYFKSFVDYYPRSTNAENASYMIGFCEYQMSPKASLDQEDTKKAIEGLQLYINQYPTGTRVDEANKLMDELRAKLEQKAYDAAMLYYNVRNYKSAATSFKNLLIEFPDTKEQEEVMFLIVKSYHLLALNSIDSKKEERYQQAANSYLEFIDKYPKSKYLREAERMYNSSQLFLKQQKS